MLELSKKEKTIIAGGFLAGVTEGLVGRLPIIGDFISRFGVLGSALVMYYAGKFMDKATLGHELAIGALAAFAKDKGADLAAGRPLLGDEGSGLLSPTRMIESSEAEELGAAEEGVIVIEGYGEEARPQLPSGLM